MKDYHDAEFEPETVTLTRAEIDALNKHNEKIKREFAREIFEEVEMALSMNWCQHRSFGSGEYVDYYAYGLADDIAKLKKKYTESEDTE